MEDNQNSSSSLHDEQQPRLPTEDYEEQIEDCDYNNQEDDGDQDVEYEQNYDEQQEQQQQENPEDFDEQVVDQEDYEEEQEQQTYQDQDGQIHYIQSKAHQQQQQQQQQQREFAEEEYRNVDDSQQGIDDEEIQPIVPAAITSPIEDKDEELFIPSQDKRTPLLHQSQVILSNSRIGKVIEYQQQSQPQFLPPRFSPAVVYTHGIQQPSVPFPIAYQHGLSQSVLRLNPVSAVAASHPLSQSTIIMNSAPQTWSAVVQPQQQQNLFSSQIIRQPFLPAGVQTATAATTSTVFLQPQQSRPAVTFQQFPQRIAANQPTVQIKPAFIQQQQRPNITQLHQTIVPSSAVQQQQPIFFPQPRTTNAFSQPMQFIRNPTQQVVTGGGVFPFQRTTAIAASNIRQTFPSTLPNGFTSSSRPTFSQNSGVFYGQPTSNTMFVQQRRA